MADAVKIVDVECLILANEHPIVRAATGGGTGGGGGCFRGAGRICKPAIEQLFKPLLIGQDPLDSERLHTAMLRAGALTGPLGSLAVAVAGVDIALWDVKGKAL